MWSSQASKPGQFTNFPGAKSVLTGLLNRIQVFLTSYKTTFSDEESAFQQIEKQRHPRIGRLRFVRQFQQMCRPFLFRTETQSSVCTYPEQNLVFADICWVNKVQWQRWYRDNPLLWSNNFELRVLSNVVTCQN